MLEIVEIKMKKINILLDLYFTFLKIGFVTFGGGLAMLPILERELVEKRKWVGSEELIDYFSIGQSTPGIIAVNVATFCGNKLGGILGGIFATFGIVTPSLIVITLISNLISSITEYEWVQKALKGINAAVAANLTFASVNFFKKAVKNLIGFICFLISFILVYFINIPAVIIILCSATLGIILFYLSKKNHSL